MAYPIREPGYDTPSSRRVNDYDKQYANADHAIVIDNGSWQMRAGWSNETSPRVEVESVATRYRPKKESRTAQLVGTFEKINGTDIVWSRGPYDPAQHIVANFDAQETLLDHAFETLGITASGAVPHPILMTEVPFTTMQSRKQMLELLFEAYTVPKVCFGIDGAFSWYANKERVGDSLVINSGQHATYLLPIWDGRLHLNASKSLAVGGLQTTEFMLKMLQIKYPAFPSVMNASQARAVALEHAYVADDYVARAYEFASPQRFDEMDVVVQFPYPMDTGAVEKTAEQQDMQEDRRRLNGLRLKEMAAAKRAEKLLVKEAELEDMETVALLAEEGQTEEYQEALQQRQFASAEQFQKTLSKLEHEVSTLRAKAHGTTPPPEQEREVPTFPLLAIPDEELDDLGKKEKRKQKMFKANYEAREKIRKAKEEDKRRQAEFEAAEQARRETDLPGWLQEHHTKRDELIKKYKAKVALKLQLQDRKSAASKARMRNIAELAADESVTATGKKRKKALQKDVDTLADDRFGASDQDWNVYQEISKEEEGGPGNEEEELTALDELDALLAEHDPDFISYKDLLVERPDPQTSYLTRSMYGFQGPPKKEDVAEKYQMHLNMERIRCPEPLFQPHMIGKDSMGLVELIDYLGRTNQIPQRVCDNILLTGTHTQWRGLPDRLQRELQMTRPVDQRPRVFVAENPRLDAWRGAARFARDHFDVTLPATLPNHYPLWITRSIYEERGAQYWIEHGLGNSLT